MEVYGLVLASVLLSFLAGTCCSTLSFSSLQRTLVVTASPRNGQQLEFAVLKAGEDNINVTWSVNKTFPSGTDSAYKNIKVKLCYAPISQVDRAWRRTEDHLSRDKTCQFNIVSRPYSTSNTTYTWTIERDIPTATYFIRAYVVNSAGTEVAYGQTTDAQKASKLFQVQAITGRHVTLDICSVCFSAFSVVSLFAFFFIDRRRVRTAQQK